MLCKSIISLQSDSSVFSISKDNGEHENRVYKFSLPNSLCNRDEISTISLLLVTGPPRCRAICLLFASTCDNLVHLDYKGGKLLSTSQFGMEISYTLLKE